LEGTIAHFLRHRHIRAMKNEVFHIHCDSSGKSGNGGGSPWWVIALAVVIGGFVAYQIVISLVAALQALIPIMVVTRRNGQKIFICWVVDMGEVGLGSLEVEHSGAVLGLVARMQAFPCPASVVKAIAQALFRHNCLKLA
jgi:hypothetical protein